MSVIEMNSRPKIRFDATNHQHRAYFQDFMKTGSWKNCPYQFFLEENQWNLVTMIQNKILNFYLNKDRKVNK